MDGVQVSKEDLEALMRKALKRLTLNRETLRNLVDPRLSGIVGGYPLSTATNCDACGSDGCVYTFTCGSSCCPGPTGCTTC